MHIFVFLTFGKKVIMKVFKNILGPICKESISVPAYTNFKIPVHYQRGCTTKQKYLFFI